MFGGRRVDRDKRSILLSAARSHIFNGVLAERVAAGRWDAPMDGEIWSLEGSRSWFGPEPFDATLAERLARFDIHPSGPLWGRGETPAADAAGELERAVAARDEDLAKGLADARMDQERRALRLQPREFAWRWLDGWRAGGFVRIACGGLCHHGDPRNRGDPVAIADRVGSHQAAIAAEAAPTTEKLAVIKDE